MVTGEQLKPLIWTQQLTTGEVRDLAPPIREHIGLNPGAHIEDQNSGLRIVIERGIAVTGLSCVMKTQVEARNGTRFSAALKVPLLGSRIPSEMLAKETTHYRALTNATHTLGYIASGVYEPDTRLPVDGHKHPYLLLELANETLAHQMSPKDKGEADETWDDLLAVAESLQDIHRLGLVHGDVKMGNAFIVKNALRRKVVLGDFGTITFVGDSSTRSYQLLIKDTEIHEVMSQDGLPTIPSAHPEAVVTPGIIPLERFEVDESHDTPPERRRYNRATQAGDIFAWGVMAFKLLSGKDPWKDTLTIANARELVERGPLGRSEFPDYINQGYVDLIYSCLEDDPELRPTAAILIEAGKAINQKRGTNILEQYKV